MHTMDSRSPSLTGSESPPSCSRNPPLTGSESPLLHSRSPSLTGSKSPPLHIQYKNATQNNQPESSSIEQPANIDTKVERSLNRQSSEDETSFSLSDSDNDNFSQQEQEETESVDQDDERTCSICRKSGFKGERGLRIHQWASKKCLAIMRNTERDQSVTSSSVGRGDDEDASSVVSTGSNASSNEIMESMDDTIERFSHLAQDQINVVHLGVPKVLVNLLHYFYRKLCNRETFQHTRNWLAPRIKRGTTVLGYLVAILAVLLLSVILLRYMFHCLANRLMHIVNKEQALTLIHEFSTHIQRKVAQLSYGFWA